LAIEKGEEGREERVVLVFSGPERHLLVARRVAVGERLKGGVRVP